MTGNSNAAFIVHGLFGAEEALRVPRDRFPTIIARFKFPIRVVSRPSELAHTRPHAEHADARG